MSLTLIYSTLASGVLNGGVYALMALAIVLIFRTTGVANFAQGEMAGLAAFLFLMIVIPLGLPLWGAWFLSLFLSGAVGAAIYFVLIRPRPGASHLNVTVRTLGLYMLIYALAVFLWGGAEPYRVPSLFSRGGVGIGGFIVSYDQIGTLAVMAAVAIIFMVIFRYTSLGLSMRATAINPEVASLLGVNVPRISLSVWVIGGILGAVAGLLIAPISFLETSLMRPYLFKAFTAAIIGGLHSFPGAIVGGLLLGVAEAVATLTISIHMREPFTFAVLLLVLLLRPAGILSTRSHTRV